jgi:4-hydroxy-tetrahydrodipicolinate reductase
MTNVAIFGAAGRMGGVLIRCAERFPGVRITAAIERSDSPAVGRDAGAVAGIREMGIAITADAGALALADVGVDFTFHEAVPGHATLAVRLGRAMVIGTTGLSDAGREAVQRAAERVPIVWAPNMSLGVNLLFSLVRQAASVLGAAYEVEIEETHHEHKKDAPSGTALRLGEKAAEGRGQDFRSVYAHEPGENRSAQQPGTIVIRSHRRGEVVGDHTVRLRNEGEEIELTHHAWSRDAFAMGALRAAEWVVGRRPGLYDMQDVLGP